MSKFTDHYASEVKRVAAEEAAIKALKRWAKAPKDQRIAEADAYARFLEAYPNTTLIYTNLPGRVILQRIISGDRVQVTMV